MRSLRESSSGAGPSGLGCARRDIGSTCAVGLGEGLVSRAISIANGSLPSRMSGTGVLPLKIRELSSHQRSRRSGTRCKWVPAWAVLASCVCCERGGLAFEGMRSKGTWWWCCTLRSEEGGRPGRPANSEEQNPEASIERERGQA